MATALAERFGARLVPEVARTYLADRGNYAAEDVLEIARLQVAAEAQAFENEPDLIVCDTDLLVIRVWWEEKFGALPEELIALLKARKTRAYLLVEPDLPWKADPLRENPRDRERLFGVYETLLSADEMPYRTVSGRGEDRLRAAIEAARTMMPARTLS